MSLTDSQERSWSRDCLAISIESLAKESTTKMMQFEFEQYFSQESLYRLWPPRSQILRVTFPCFTYLMFTPTVGMESSMNWPVCRELIRVLFPAFWRPTTDSSSSF